MGGSRDVKPKVCMTAEREAATSTGQSGNSYEAELTDGHIYILIQDGT